MSAPGEYASVVAYDAMCDAIERYETTLTSELDEMSVDDQLRLCAFIIKSNQDVERRVGMIRVRAADAYYVLLRHSAGERPRHKRDAKWLERFETGPA